MRPAALSSAPGIEPQRGIDRCDQRVRIIRFCDEIEGAALDNAHDGRYGADCTKKDDRHACAAPLQFFHQLQIARAGQLRLEQEASRVIRAGPREERLRAVIDCYTTSSLLKQLA